MSSIQNPRKEIEISVCGLDFRVRPTFTLIASVEQAFNQGVFAIGQKVVRQEIGLFELANILFLMTRPSQGMHPLTLEKIGEHLMDVGWKEYINPVSTLLLTAVIGANPKLQSPVPLDSGSATTIN